MRTFKEILTEYYQSNTEPIPTTNLEYLCSEIVKNASPTHVPLLTFIRDTMDGKPATQASVPTEPPDQKITIFRRD